MICPKCKGTRLMIINTRTNDIETVRERHCTECRASFYTVETFTDFESGKARISEYYNSKKYYLNKKRKEEKDGIEA